MSDKLSNNFLVKIEQSKANLESNLDLAEVSILSLLLLSLLMFVA